jgi:hypothetical protein
MNFKKVDQLKMLIDDIRLASGIIHVEAERVLEAVSGLLGARLPSPVVECFHGAPIDKCGPEGLGNANN